MRDYRETSLPGSAADEVPIPTLDRYGLALLMLLTLGIGAVGIRRFY